MKTRVRNETAARWSVRAVLFAAAAIAVTAIAFYIFAPAKPSAPDINTGPTYTPSSGDVSNANRAKADAASLRERVATAETTEALSLLVSTRKALKSETPAYIDAALPELVNLHEQFLFRAHGTTQEAESRLELSRLYQYVGYRSEWLSSFDVYVDAIGDKANKDAVEQNMPDLEKRRFAYSAKAAAYLEEAMRLYQEEDYMASVELSGRLLKLYPLSGRAYEGQMLATRCYVAMNQPEGAIEAYRRIANDAPDRKAAQAAGETLLKMLVLTRDADRVSAEAKALRERFADETFQRFAMLEEAKVLHRGSEPARAVNLYLDIRSRWPDTPEGKVADKGFRQLQDIILFNR